MVAGDRGLTGGGDTKSTHQQVGLTDIQTVSRQWCFEKGACSASEGGGCKGDPRPGVHKNSCVIVGLLAESDPTCAGRDELHPGSHGVYQRNQYEFVPASKWGLAHTPSSIAHAA